MATNIATGLSVGPQVGFGDGTALNLGQPIKFFQSHLP